MDKYKKYIIQIACLVLLVIAADVKGENSYVLVSPNVVRPGQDFTIHGSLLKSTSRPVTITAELHGDTIIASASVTVTGRNDVKLDIPVPADVNVGDRKSLRLQIQGTGGLTFTETKSVKYDPKSVSVYIQTDKAMYKPGQTVKFRVFGTTPDLKIVYDKLKVELFDPKGNKINQWDVSNAELTSLNGVYIQQQVMSDEPVLGKWKLRAKLLSYGGEFEEKSFEIAEYVLPKFEVELDLPPFGRSDVTDLKGKVKATYTFGQPVKGIVDLRVKPKNERFQWRDNQRVSVSKTYEIKMPINGEKEFTIPVSKLKEIQKFLSGSVLVFEANVTEDLTKFKQSDEQDLSFYDNAIKLSIPKSLPDTFKPGMTYDAVVIVSQQDDTPPDAINGQLKVTITEYRRTKRFVPPIPDPEPFPIDLPVIGREQQRRQRRRPVRLSRMIERFRRQAKRSIMPPWRPPTRETSKTLPPSYHTIPADGIVTFPINVDKDVTKIRIFAEYSGVSVDKTLKKRHSPSNSYLQMRLLTNKPMVDQTADIEVKSTSSPGEFTYQIYSRGTIVDSGTVRMHGKEMVWTPRISAKMAPRAKIVAFYVRSDGEIIADALVINIDGSVYDNKVGIQFSKTEAAPGEPIQVDVTADTGSDVHVLGVDKSVLLLASGNDVTNQQVLQELREFDTKGKGQSFPSVCGWWCLRWPVSVGGEDVKDVFDDAGVLVFTDATVYDHYEPPIFMPMMRRFGSSSMMADGGGFGAIAMRPDMAMAAPAKSADMQIMVPDVKLSLDNLAPVQRTRKLFPETWLWESRKIQSGGKVTIQETVPDTMTSWIASAFAVHPNTGLGVSDPSPQLTVSLPFFVTVNLPYSVIRGEKVLIQVNIHNYSPQDQFTRVVFSKSDAFKNIVIDGTTQSTTSADITRTVMVPANGVSPLYFPIIPEIIGLVDIKIQAQSNAMADAIHKRLIVEAEGSPREYNIPILADFKGDKGSLTKTVDITYPARKVSGSEVVRVTVIGDLMGPSISGLDALIKLPSGCGEQNMLKFSPNIFVVKYLEATNTISENILKKAKDFMKTGYQKELTYAHSDGSYSAFGERDDSGSTWLTAFVIKSFVQAKPYIFIDDNVIHKAADWLIKHQNSNGSFNEPGRVIHKAMQGGSTSGETSLTAYVLIALLEARSIEGVAEKIASAQKSAQTYLEGQIPQMTDVYDLAIVSYALQLAGSPQADVVWNKLDAKAISIEGTKHWEQTTVVDDTKPWAKRNGVAINIEITAYALLTLALKKDRTEGVKVLKWITEQRNPQGGFSSTQDTVLALQGLAEMAALIYSPNHDITVTVTSRAGSETFTITNLNAQVLQTRNLPTDVESFTVTATGTGLALIQVEVLYNIDDDDQKRSFDLTVTLPRESLNDFEVKACARWLEQGSSSMAVMEIGSPSGFIADLVSVISEPVHKRVELDDKKLVLYFDEIGAQETCATVTMHRTGMVAGAQPVAVRVYDYYEPTKQVTEFYVPLSLRNSEVCEICGAECDVCNKP